MEALIFKVAIVLLVGFIGGRIAKRFNLPKVSGYLLLGLILGPSLGLIFRGYEGFITQSDQNTLKFISEIALAFIAFSIGSEFSLKNLKGEGKSYLTIANFETGFAFLTVFLVLFFIPKPEPIMVGYQPFSNGNIAFGLVLASMSAATAPAATLIVMRQYRAYGPLSKSILPVVAVDDIYGIVIFGFAISIAKMLVSTTEVSLALMFLKPFFEVFGSLIIGGIVGFILVLIVNKVKKISEDYQVISIAAIMLVLGIVGILNNVFSEHSLGLSSLLANMMAGAMISNLVKKPDGVFKSVNHFTTPFYVLFFTLAGASLDLGILSNGILITVLAVAYIFARAFGKYIGAYLGAAKIGAPKLVRKYLGFALLPQGGVSLGLLVIVAVQLPEQYELIKTIIMLSILVYETSGPIFAKFAIGRAGEINGMDLLNKPFDVEEVSEGA